LQISTAAVESDRRQVYLAIGRDMTEIFAAQHKLAATERKYSSIVANIPGVLWSRGLDGTLLFVTPQSSQILGTSPEELIRQSREPSYERLARIHPDDRPKAAAAFQVLVTRGTPLDMELRFQHGDGRWIWLHAQAALATDENGEVRMDGVFIDVTARKELEQQIMHAQKLEAVGQLTAAVAHDYNNVLAVILATGELLLDELPPSSSSRELVQEIVAAAERGSALTKQLLVASRRDSAERCSIDVNAVLRGVEPMLKRLLGSGATFELDLGKDLGFVHADQGQVDQVLMNLVQNARDAMHGKGNVLVSSANVEREGRSFVRLSVRDTGSGMDTATIAKAFEPFFTTKPKGKGTGLGLSTCQMIAKDSGGFLEVDSELGAGTTFHLLLPRVSTSAAASVRRAGREIILVVEDNDRIRELTRRILEASGHEVLCADGRAEARRLASKHRGIRLLLCDLNLGDETAVDVIGDVRRLIPSVRVMIMSGSPRDPLLREQALAHVPFLAKPFGAPALIATVHAMFARRAA
jgi:PAS domain S-box-containing protein